MAEEKRMSIIKVSVSIFLLLSCLCFAEENKEPIIVTSEEAVRQYSAEHNVTCESSGITLCTGMWCGSGKYINGVWVNPEPCNTCTSYFTCSDGTQFEVKKKSY